MPNARLTTLFTVYEVHPEDQQEMNRIFDALNESGQQRILDRFPEIINRIKKSREKLDNMKEEIINRALEKLEQKIESIHTK